MTFDVNNRFRAIATNAVREARIAKQIDQGPWLDDHASRLEVIFQILTGMQIESDANFEHYPLVNQSQPEPDRVLGRVSEALSKMEEDLAGVVSPANPAPFKLAKPKPAA